MHVPKVMEVTLEEETTPKATGILPENRESQIVWKHE